MRVRFPEFALPSFFRHNRLAELDWGTRGMTDSLVFACAAGAVLVAWIYAASLLRQLYLTFRVAERVQTVAARATLDLAKSRIAQVRPRPHAHALAPANDNPPPADHPATGTQ